MRTTLAVLALALLGMGQTAVDPLPPLEGKPPALIANHFPGWILPQPPLPLTKRQMVNWMFPADFVDGYWLEDYDRLADADLVSVPDDPLYLGIRVRTSGKFPIAEKEPDPKLKRLLTRLRKPSASLLYLVAERFRQKGASAPPELTSMVRTWAYQKRLMRTNPNANVKAQGVPATHVLGLAFDIGRATMTRADDRRMAQTLDELEDEGLLLYFLEGKAQAAYHVIAIPPALSRLEAAYDGILASAALAAEEAASAASAQQ